MKTLIEKLTPYLIGLGLLVGFVFSCNKAMKEAQQKKRVERALVITQQPAKSITGKDGQKAIKTDVMQLTTQELKNTYPDLTDKAKNFSIKSRLIQGASEQYFKDSLKIKAKLRDSVIFKIKDSLRVDTLHVKVFLYSDLWTQIKAVISDSASVSIESRDTLTTILHKGDRVHPWLWVLSKRKLQQTILNKNPHTKIIFQRAIQVH